MGITPSIPESALLQKKLLQLSTYRMQLRTSECGTLNSVGDGIAWIKGLPSAAMDEILEFDDGSKALVFYLGKNRIGAILLHQAPMLTAGARVYRSGMQLSVPVGDALLGRVVGPLGEPLDGAGALECTAVRPLDPLSPPITMRAFVDESLYTGTRVVDCLIPIGKGQRQLVIGDAGLGKSSLCLGAVINQRDKNVLCVYVLIGQKRSTVAQIVDTLRKTGALAYAAVVGGQSNCACLDCNIWHRLPAAPLPKNGCGRAKTH